MTDAADDHVRVRGAESRIEFAVVWAFTLLAAATLAYVHTRFAPLMPAARLWAWSGFAAAVVAIMLIVPAVVLFRRPSDAEIQRVWSPVGKVVAVLYDLAVASSVWALLPYADEPLRLLMVVFYAAAVSGQVISTAESLGTVAFGVVSILGSAALFFLNSSDSHSGALALFLCAFGGLMLGVAVTLKAAVRSALTARLKAERVSGELAAALAQAHEARDARTRFMAAASHDLRQPLQAAVLFFEQMLRTPDPSMRNRAVAGVKLAFEETGALLESMLDHLRLDAGALEVRCAPVLAGELIERTVREVEALAAAEGVRLSFARSNCWVAADQALAARVLRNFLHNSLRHAGGRRILIGARRRGACLRLYVLDDGRGVPAGDRPGLFQPYVQGLRTGREARGGLGLGLASARRMAELMNGAVDLDSAWTGGAAFYLELPRTAAGRTPVGRAEPAVAAAVGLRRVLILDDDPAAREALSGLFVADGWRVAGAASSAEARRLAEAGPFDLMIADWRLDEAATGADAVNEVRRVAPGLPAMLVTGDGTRESHEAIAVSGLPVLFKPTPADRVLALAEQLRRRVGEPSGVGETRTSRAITAPSAAGVDGPSAG